MSESLPSLIEHTLACRACEAILPQDPRPIFQVSDSATLLIAGQAPGIKAHDSNLPFNDRSGDRLRDWLGIDRTVFYDASRVVLLPMAFCYPGTAAYGDLPPPPQCAALWRTKYLSLLTNVKLTVACGTHAVRWYYKQSKTQNLSKVVRSWRDFPKNVIALPHPSPRNNGWLKRNPWFEQEVLPELQTRVSEVLFGNDKAVLISQERSV